MCERVWCGVVWQVCVRVWLCGGVSVCESVSVCVVCVCVCVCVVSGE